MGGIMIVSALGEEIEIGLPFAQAADDAAIVDGVLVYDNDNGSTTTPLVLEDGSVQILTTIADFSAPIDYAYPLGIPSGAVLSLTPDGGAQVATSDGLVIVSIAAPWAYDANGAPVPTRYEVNGTTLTQVVGHGPDTAYPVVADPSISYGWWRYVHFNRAETKTIANGGWGVAAITAICMTAGGPAAGAACAAQVGSIVYTAGIGENSSPKRCLFIKFLYVSPVAISGTYRVSRCV